MKMPNPFCIDRCTRCKEFLAEGEVTEVPVQAEAELGSYEEYIADENWETVHLACVKDDDYSVIFA